eukprot:2119256-Rhodomonas_salina.1
MGAAHDERGGAGDYGGLRVGHRRPELHRPLEPAPGHPSPVCVVRMLLSMLAMPPVTLTPPLRWAMAAEWPWPEAGLISAICLRAL